MSATLSFIQIFLRLLFKLCLSIVLLRTRGEGGRKIAIYLRTYYVHDPLAQNNKKFIFATLICCTFQADQCFVFFVKFSKTSTWAICGIFIYC